MKKPLITENIGLEHERAKFKPKPSAFLINCPKRGDFEFGAGKIPNLVTLDYVIPVQICCSDTDS